MKLFEYQAKQFLSTYGVPIPAGKVASTAEEAAQITTELGKTVVLKGQVHSGGRGKAGAVKLAKTPDEARQIAQDLIGKTLFFAQANADLRVDKLLIEEALPIKHEIYVAITQDRASQRDILIVSTMGGMDIEAVAHDSPEAISQTAIDPLLGLTDYLARIALFAAGFDKAYINMMVKGHTKMLMLMKGEESSSDADLKDFATKTSDVVQMHLTKAKDIQKSMM